MLEGTSRIGLVLSEIENEGILPLGVLELIQKNTQEMGLELVAVLGRFIGLEKQDVIIGDILMKLRLVNDFPDHSPHDYLFSGNPFVEVLKDRGILSQLRMGSLVGRKLGENISVELAFGRKREVEQVIVPNTISIAEQQVVERVKGLGVLGDDVAEGFLVRVDDVGSQHDNDFSVRIAFQFLFEKITEEWNLGKDGDAGRALVLVFAD